MNQNGGYGFILRPLTRQEPNANRVGNGQTPDFRQPTGVLIDLENGHVSGTLIRRKQILSGRVDRKISRCLPQCFLVAHRRPQFLRLTVPTKNGQTVMTTI